MTAAMTRPRERLPENRIAELRKALGMTMEELAERIKSPAMRDVSPSTIDKLEKGKMRLTDKYVGPIAAALEVAPGELFAGRAPGSGPAAATAREVLPHDLPLRGAVKGGHTDGGRFFPDEPAGWLGRPPALAGARLAYAAYVSGRSMDPDFKPGQLVIADPARPVHAEDVVVVVTRLHDRAPCEAFIGFLVEDGPVSVWLHKRAKGEDSHHDKRTVITIDRVLSPNEILGG